MRLGALLTTLLLFACGADSSADDAGAGTGGVAATGGSSGASANGGAGGRGGAGSSGGSPVGGASGTSGGSSGIGGDDAGAGNGGGAAGSGGEGGGDAGASDAGAVDCPDLEPFEGGACEGQGQCAFTTNDSPGCGRVLECFESKWVAVFRSECVGPSLDMCPEAASALEGDPCIQHSCVYAPNLVCACEQPCSGVAPDPETFVMRCSAAPSAVCVQEKQAGAACAPIGTVCAPACCGTMWTCTAQGWSVGEVLCPP